MDFRSVRVNNSFSDRRLCGFDAAVHRFLMSTGRDGNNTSRGMMGSLVRVRTAQQYPSRERMMRGIGLQMTRTIVIFAVMLIASCAPSISHTQNIDPSRGVDSAVDYEALTEIGPWDDRNYQLTAKDLEVLASNESELKDAIPVFYRVLLRRGNPALQTSGPAQYPRSALPSFLQLCGGYLINGRYFRSVTIKDGRFLVMIESDGDKGAPATARLECNLSESKDDQVIGK